MKGKEKCRILKEIRQQIAKENDIPFITSQCTHQGDCKGTCPKCESELRYLEKELALRQKLGKAVAVVGISVGACSTLTACDSVSSLDSVKDIITDTIDRIRGNEPEVLSGDVMDIAGMEEYDPSMIDGGIEEYDPDMYEENTEYATSELAGDIEYIPEE